MKKIVSLIILVFILMSLFTGCTSDNKSSNNQFSIGMVTDTGGINDQSFNTSAWEGLQSLSKDTGAKISYIESKQTTDYTTNLDSFADQNCDLVWAIGFSMSDSVLNASKSNPDIKYAIVDNSYEDDTPNNVTGVMFRSEETAFLAGYIAGKTTKTDKVGFVGGIEGNIIRQFEYGYRAGVDYASKELGKSIKTDIQYIETFSDATKAKATTSKMMLGGCDIVFHAAGGAGIGVIEAAKEANKFAIGVDRDQAYLAPNNVLTSAIKNVGEAVKLVSQSMMFGENISGKTMIYGIKDGCIGIPENNPNLSLEVYEDTLEVQQKIMDGEIIPPDTKEAYNAYKSSL